MQCMAATVLRLLQDNSSNRCHERLQLVMHTPPLLLAPR